MTDGPEIIVSIDAPHFNAGIVAQGGRVIEAAHIVKYMKGWTGQQVADYCHKKGWTWDVQQAPVPILVCGGRDFADRALVFYALDRVLAKFGTVAIVQGGARGADATAHEWATFHKQMLINCPANWQLHGKAAGPIRNQFMLDQWHPKLVVAFPGGRGTADMVKRAHDGGVEVRELP